MIISISTNTYGKINNYCINIGSDKTSDKELDAFIREKGDSAYHPSCTCKMGDPNDPMAVVGPDTKVLGELVLRSQETQKNWLFKFTPEKLDRFEKLCRNHLVL